MVSCKFCGVEREKNIYQHERMCPKNPERVMPSLKDKTKTETKKIEPENNTKIEKQDEGRLAFDAPAKTAIPDDKTVVKKNPPSVTTLEAGTGLSASTTESETEEEEQPQPQKKSWLVEICIAIIFIVLAAIAFFLYIAIPEKDEKYE